MGMQDAMDTSSFLPGTGTEARLAAMLRDFDRYLKSDAVIEKMTLEEAAYVLDQIALFNTEADHGRLEIEMSAEANPPTRSLSLPASRIFTPTNRRSCYTTGLWGRKSSSCTSRSGMAPKCFATCPR